MQKSLIFVVTILLAVCFSNAAFVNADLKDSRLQMDNSVYEPAGIVGLSLEFGLFNEPENLIDYTTAVGIRRLGYSYYDGDESVALWEVYIKFLTWAVNYKNFMLEFSMDVGKPFSDGTEFGYSEGISALIGYGFRFGYRITDQFMVSAVANYQGSINSGDLYVDDKTWQFGVGGWGLNFQWNIPWIPF